MSPRVRYGPLSPYTPRGRSRPPVLDIPSRSFPTGYRDVDAGPSGAGARLRSAPAVPIGVGMPTSPSPWVVNLDLDIYETGDPGVLGPDNIGVPE